MSALKMGWNLLSYIFLLSVSQTLVAFNIDPNPWKDFTTTRSVAFGYRVIQKTDNSLLVSDPLIQDQKNRGQVYNCNVNQGSCSPLAINVPTEAINMSLGLSMSKDPQTLNSVVCGPTIPKDCKQITAYNGMCFTLDSNNRLSNPIPKQLRDCPSAKTDIAFLMDGSGSVSSNDFLRMKTFIISMVNGLKDKGFQFAVAQYSNYCEIHIKFNTFRSINQIQTINQINRGTYTARAIRKVVNEVFTINAGARKDASRVLVVITDGQSQDSYDLIDAAQHAEDQKIIRYAIGVGNAFRNPSAERELNIIASDPDVKHVFKVNDFSVLEEIRNTLEETIIAIEGTENTGESAKMEFAQDGFSAHFFPNGQIIMGAVGAFQGKGGYQMYSGGEPSGNFRMGDYDDSYLGYSTTVASLMRNKYIIQGAPRHNHTGKVIISDNTGIIHSLIAPKPQIGAYYGAELCMVDLDSNTVSDLLLVSAPLHNEMDQEGKVFVYSITAYKVLQVTYKQALKGIPGQKGRFGMTLASPADLNRDGKMDVVIGAPLEDNGMGSIYIFNGRNEDIAPTHSQRISGSSVRRGLQHFGISLSQSSLDHSQDQLPDLAVGSKGAVTLLRSRPIVDLKKGITYNPSKIPTRDTDCTNPLKNTLTLCFTMDRLKNHPQSDLNANVNYIIKLDAKRQSYRAYFSPKIREQSGTISLSLQEKCNEHIFFIEACTNDALNPIINELMYTFEGLPSQRQGYIRPMLPPTIKYSSDYNLDFEINCGIDNVCVDDLKMDFNFSGHSVIQVGIMQEMNVTVFIQNSGENSYNSRFLLKYPFGLSFRRFTTKQGRLECVSVDSDEKAVLGETICYISKPIFKNNDLAVFDITYNINKDSNFEGKVTFTAVATSDNDRHGSDMKLSKQKSIDVKYAIYVALIRHENTTIHINFTSGKNDLHKPIQQILKVENDLRDLNMDIYIRVPIKLGDKDIWTNILQIPGCNEGSFEKPNVTDFVSALKKKPELNCSIATCKAFKCPASLTRMQPKFYNISGNVSSGWIEQTGLRSAIFMLASTATVDYNRTTYIYFSSDSVNTEPAGKIDTQVEVYEETFPLKETIGGIAAGIVLLALITAALYKAGFFKSNYKKMLEEAGAGAEGTGNGAEAPAED